MRDMQVTRPWWRKEFWKPWDGRGRDRRQQGERLHTQPDSSSQDVV